MVPDISENDWNSAWAESLCDPNRTENKIAVLKRDLKYITNPGEIEALGQNLESLGIIQSTNHEYRAAGLYDTHGAEACARNGAELELLQMVTAIGGKYLRIVHSTEMHGRVSGIVQMAAEVYR